MKTYKVTAEHTCGKSVSHPCTHGVYDDPTESFETTVEAESAERAVAIGWAELLAIAEAQEPCDCKRHLQPGSNSWVNSVCVHAELLAPR